MKALNNMQAITNLSGGFDSSLALEIPPLLRELNCVVVAIVDLNGRRFDWNRGFQSLCDLDESITYQNNVRSLFVQPDFSEFTAIQDEVSAHDTLIVYQGIMSLGNSETFCRSISGVVYRRGDQLMIVGEYDIDDQEKLSAAALTLNEELAQTQRDLLKANRRLILNEKKISELLATDCLTGIANRRAFEEQVEKEIQGFKRHRRPFCLAIADIDLFKQVNDTYGHDVGDEVIKVFAETLNANKRALDFCARIGGEEFVFTMPDTRLEQSVVVMDRLRKIFSEDCVLKDGARITASVGVTEVVGEDEKESLLKRADNALYEAKENGRNRVERSA